MRAALPLLALALSGCTPLPEAPPPGTAFLFMGGENRALTRGLRPVPKRELRGRVLTFQRVRGSRLVFRLEGDGREVSALKLPDTLAPTLEDAAVRALLGRLARRRVWMYGGAIGGHEGERVRNVWRLKGTFQVETRGFGGGGPYTRVSQPLLMAFERERPVLYANAAAFQRFFSLTPPPAQPTVAPSSLVGLTKLDVLWQRGTPDLTPGTLGQVLRADEWRWSNLPGRGDAVVRFRAGRAVRVEWTRLP